MKMSSESLICASRLDGWGTVIFQGLGSGPFGVLLALKEAGAVRFLRKRVVTRIQSLRPFND